MSAKVSPAVGAADKSDRVQEKNQGADSTVAPASPEPATPEKSSRRGSFSDDNLRSLPDHDVAGMSIDDLLSAEEEVQAMDAQVPRNIREELVASLLLTLRISVFAVVGLTQELYWVARLFVFDVHVGDDPVFVPTSTHGIFIFHALLVLTFSFLPCMLAAYTRMPIWRAALVFGVPIVAWSAGWQYIHLAAIWKLAMPYIWIPIALRLFVVTGKSSLPWKAISFFVSLMVGNMLVIFVNSNDLSNSVAKRILFTSVIVPMVKEVTASWFRSSTRGLVTKRDMVIGHTNRGVPWAQLLLIQIVWAVYGRMLFSEAENDLVLAAIVVMQGAMELALRLSIRWRDHKMRTLKRFASAALADFLGHGLFERHASVLEVPNSNIFRDVGERHRDSIERVFYGMVVLCDMLAEYIGILMAPIIIITFSGNIILIPLDYYNRGFKQDNPSARVELWPLARWVALQLVAELIVDALCIAYERRHIGINLERIWSYRPSNFIPWVAFASLGAAPFVYLTLDTDLCDAFDNNYCRCSNGNGLTSGGLMERYCMSLYPSTFGVP